MDGLELLDAAATRFGFSLEWEQFDWSCERYTRTGQMMPEDGLDQLRGFDAIFLDGFTPARNTAMWTPDVMTRLSQRCAPSATAAGLPWRR